MRSTFYKVLNKMAEFDESEKKIFRLILFERTENEFVTITKLFVYKFMKNYITRSISIQICPD